jgi:Cu/Ag efflux pump CusA
VVYLTLSAQYESFVLPFIILLAVPMAVLGALGAQAARGLQNDVYCQIGLVMLIGLASKNAILIVEFAEQLQHRGMGLVESAIEAARLHLLAKRNWWGRAYRLRHSRPQCILAMAGNPKGIRSLRGLSGNQST